MPSDPLEREPRPILPGEPKGFVGEFPADGAFDQESDPADKVTVEEVVVGSKTARATLDNAATPRVSFQIGDQEVNATLFPGDRPGESGKDYVTGFEDSVDHDGNRRLRILKLPRILTEAKETTVEFYDSHKNLVKSAGATGIAVGVITVGSLVVHRVHRQQRRK